jgi:hypothetical protein
MAVCVASGGSSFAGSVLSSVVVMEQLSRPMWKGTHDHRTTVLYPRVSPSGRFMPQSPLLRTHEFFRRGASNAEGWSQLVGKGREWESFYRERWQHDKVVRSTHGVNCTGSCSWNVYVKDGLITWEAQAAPGVRRSPGTRTRRSA